MAQKGAQAPAAAADGAPRHVFLVDGSGFIFRAFHALPAMTRPDGTPVNAVYGFTTMLMKIVDETDADYVGVIFDTAAQTFRSGIYKEYKANRPPPPEELVPQFTLVRDAVRAMCVACIEQEGYEADDLIATYAKQAAALGAEVTIVSSDKDLMQLIGPRVKMFDAMRNKKIAEPEVMEKFGVGPDKVIDVQALAGDSIDNVPGIRGIGVKTAAQLINEYGDLDTLLARAGEIKKPKLKESLTTQADLARISRDLVRLEDNVPLAHPLSDMKKQEPDLERMRAFLKEQSFKSLTLRFETKHKLAPSTQAIETPDQKAMAPRKSTAAQPQIVDDTPPPISADGYVLVEDEASLAKWTADARDKGVVALAVQTSVPNPMRSELCGISLALPGGKACYVPLAHRSGGDQLDLAGGSAPTFKQITREKGLALLKPLMEDASVLKIGQDIKMAMEVLFRYGIELAPIDDPMIISYVLDGGKRAHGKDELAQELFEHATFKIKDLVGSGKSQVDFDQVPPEKARAYAAEEADLAVRAHHALKPRLVEEHLVGVYETIERPLISVLADMEETGIKVDAKVLRKLSDDFGRRIADLENDIHRMAGHSFNVGSPKQLGEVLFDELGLPGGKKGKTGAYGTGADILEGLADEGHELPARVLDWRQLTKLKNTYTDTLVEEINAKTGRVHTYYAQAVASTGRLSSTEPNLQNIPIRTEEGRKIRTAFVPADGHVLMSADYSQIELRLLAHVAKIPALIEAFKAGADIHAMTASQVFGVPVEGMDPNVRRQAKAINFGIIYGISAFGLARQLGIARGDAQVYIDAYFQKYPGIRAYMEGAKEVARKQGFVTTLFGRRCHIPGIHDKNPSHRNFAERAAINAPIQGGAADIIKRAMIRVPRALEEAGLKARMLLQVHDELVFEVPEQEVEKTTAIACRVMESVAQLAVPLVVDTGVGRNWDEAH